MTAHRWYHDLQLKVIRNLPEHRSKEYSNGVHDDRASVSDHGNAIAKSWPGSILGILTRRGRENAMKVASEITEWNTWKAQTAIVLVCFGWGALVAIQIENISTFLGGNAKHAR
jgi:hypothetical protein